MGVIKSTKRLTISNHAKNSHGFRTRTEGISLEQFNTNPLLLWMHTRPEGKSKDEILPLGYWEEIQLNGEQLSGIPVFDDTDAFAMAIYNKVENGTIKMASAGLTPVDFKEDNGELWLWNSSLFEASLCDIGSNPEALAVSLYNDEFETITLSDVYKKVNPKIDTNMKIKLTATAAKILNLAEGHEMDASEALMQVVTLANEQAASIVTLTTAKTDAETKLADQLKLTADADKVLLLDTAEKVDFKITADERPFLLKMETADLKEYLLKKPSQKPAGEQIQTGADAPDAALLKLSWDELSVSNKLITLKEKNIDAFKLKFKEKFNKEYVPAN